MGQLAVGFEGVSFGLEFVFSENFSEFRWNSAIGFGENCVHPNDFGSALQGIVNRAGDAVAVPGPPADPVDRLVVDIDDENFISRRLRPANSKFHVREKARKRSEIRKNMGTNVGGIQFAFFAQVRVVKSQAEERDEWQLEKPGFMFHPPGLSEAQLKQVR